MHTFDTHITNQPYMKRKYLLCERAEPKQDILSTKSHCSVSFYDICCDSVLVIREYSFPDIAVFATECSSA